MFVELGDLYTLQCLDGILRHGQNNYQLHNEVKKKRTVL